MTAGVVRNKHITFDGYVLRRYALRQKKGVEG